MIGSKSFFDFVTKTSNTSKRKLSIELQNVKDAFSCFKFNDVALISLNHNLADASTNSKQFAYNVIPHGRKY